VEFLKQNMQQITWVHKPIKLEARLSLVKEGWWSSPRL
jgi:hypothetical protein